MSVSRIARDQKRGLSLLNIMKVLEHVRVKATQTCFGPRWLMFEYKSQLCKCHRDIIWLFSTQVSLYSMCENMISKLAHSHSYSSLPHPPRHRRSLRFQTQGWIRCNTWCFLLRSIVEFDWKTDERWLPLRSVIIQCCLFSSSVFDHKKWLRRKNN